MLKGEVKIDFYENNAGIKVANLFLNGKEVDSFSERTFVGLFEKIKNHLSSSSKIFDCMASYSPYSPRKRKENIN